MLLCLVYLFSTFETLDGVAGCLTHQHQLTEHPQPLPQANYVCFCLGMQIYV